VYGDFVSHAFQTQNSKPQHDVLQINITRCEALVILIRWVAPIFYCLNGTGRSNAAPPASSTTNTPRTRYAAEFNGNGVQLR
jgi:hypothetical protein